MTVEVFDMLGRQVMRTLEQNFQAGASHTIPLDASALPFRHLRLPPHRPGTTASLHRKQNHDVVKMSLLKDPHWNLCGV